MSTQQVQPALQTVVRQSQHDWIILQHVSSPVVQLIVQPLSVTSQRVIPIVRLTVQTATPLRMQTQLHMPPISEVHRFCSMLRAIGSSQMQTTFTPSLVFSNLKVQRGTIRKFDPTGPTPGMDCVTPWTLVRSIIIVLVIPRPPILSSDAPSFGSSRRWRVSIGPDLAGCNDFAAY